jgi:hypothetical protein
MRAVYPAETPPCSWRPFAAGRVIGWRRTTQRHCHSRVVFVTPLLRARFFEPRARVAILSGGFGYGLYEGSSVLQNGVANAEIHRSVATAQFGGGIDVRSRLKLLFRIGFKGEVRDFYTSAFQFSEHSSTMSPSREDSLSTISRLRQGSPLVNMEDRMLDRLADHKRKCQHRSHEGNGNAEFLTQRHWLLSPASGRPVSGTPGVPQYQ